MPDPDVAAVLLTIVLASLAGLPGAAGVLRRRRELRRACVSCGRRIFLGERTCDCDF